jgi:hypothetical protein
VSLAKPILYHSGARFAADVQIPGHSLRTCIVDACSVLVVLRVGLTACWDWCHSVFLVFPKIQLKFWEKRVAVKAVVFGTGWSGKLY